MKLWGLVGLLVLGGCDDFPQARTKTEIKAFAAEQNAPLIAASARHDAEISELQARLDRLERSSEATGRTVDAVATQVNHNAEVANNNALQEMTEAGACGKEWATASDGSYYLRNKRCTRADMRR